MIWHTRVIYSLFLLYKNNRFIYYFCFGWVLEYWWQVDNTSFMQNRKWNSWFSFEPRDISSHFTVNTFRFSLGLLFPTPEPICCEKIKVSLGMPKTFPTAFEDCALQGPLMERLLQEAGWGCCFCMIQLLSAPEDWLACFTWMRWA